jgi:hypothetical protein
MVGVDLHFGAGGPFADDGESCRPARQSLRKRNRCASVQHAEGLSRAAVHRHPSGEVVTTKFGEFDAEMTYEA